MTFQRLLKKLLVALVVDLVAGDRVVGVSKFIIRLGVVIGVLLLVAELVGKPAVAVNDGELGDLMREGSIVDRSVVLLRYLLPPSCVLRFR